MKAQPSRFDNNHCLQTKSVYGPAGRRVVSPLVTGRWSLFGPACTTKVSFSRFRASTTRRCGASGAAFGVFGAAGDIRYHRDLALGVNQLTDVRSRDLHRHHAEERTSGSSTWRTPQDRRAG